MATPVADYSSDLRWMADALRGSMDASEYKHVVPSLIFLNHISDEFVEFYAKLKAEQDQGADPDDPDDYRPMASSWCRPKLGGRLRRTSLDRLPTYNPLVLQRRVVLQGNSWADFEAGNERVRVSHDERSVAEEEDLSVFSHNASL